MGWIQKNIKYVCSAITISRGRARSLRRRDLRIRNPKEGLGRVSLERTRGRIKRRTRKQKRRRKLPSFWLKTPRRSGCTLYPEHNPLVSLCKAIGDINTRVRQANEKIKTMTAWHLVKNKWGHSYRIYIITTSSYNHAKKLNTTDPKGGRPSNTDLFNESNTIDHDSSYTFSSESVRHDRSPNIKNAMEKEINGLLARLTRFRTSLQETLDNGSQDSGGAQVCGLYIYLVIYMWDIYHIYQDFPWVSSIAMLFHGRIKRLRKPWKMPKKVLVISMKRWSRSQARNGRLTSQRIPVLPKKSRFVNALAHLLIKTNFGTSFYEINQCLNQVQQFSSIFFSNLIVPAGLVWSMRGVGISCL